MPNLTAWPTAAQLVETLNSRGLVLPDNGSAQGYVDQAVRAWENLCGFGFLGDGTSSDVLYNAPGNPLLHLGRWWSSITAVAVGVSEADPTGTALDIGSNCFLEQSPIGKIWGLTFAPLFGGCLESVKVTGVTGWASSDAGDADYLPDDAWQAVLNYAAALAMDDSRQMQGVVSEVKSADVTMKFAEPADHMQFADAAMKRLRAASAPYRIIQF